MNMCGWYFVIPGKKYYLIKKEKKKSGRGTWEEVVIVENNFCSHEEYKIPTFYHGNRKQGKYDYSIFLGINDSCQNLKQWLSIFTFPGIFLHTFRQTQP